MMREKRARMLQEHNQLCLVFDDPFGGLYMCFVVR